MKYLISIIILVLLATLTQAEIELSMDNITWADAGNYGVEIYVENGTAIVDGLDESTLYYFRARNASSNWTYTSQRTKGSGEIPMASLAIMGFVLTLIVGLFILPFKTNFSKNQILNNVLKRCCWLLSLFLLSLSTAMLATIADNVGIELSSEIFRFMWIINWAAYLLMVFIILTFLFKVLKMWTMLSKQKRMGDFDNK